MARVALVVTLATLLTFDVLAGTARAEPREQVWLAVSDLHLDIFDRSPDPTAYGADTNMALFTSAVREMKRAVHDPPVILLPGDFLMHGFALEAAANGGLPNALGVRTMRVIAAELRRTFPNAQFAIALGNNDVPCGDYRTAAGSEYMQTIARIWQPSIDRKGASPEFAALFARGGFYTARLPARGLRLVVLNTVVFSSEYRGDCSSEGSNLASDEMRWLSRTMHATPPGTRNVVMMHIPVGIDAFSTEYTRGLLTWRFLEPRYDGEIVNALRSLHDPAAFAIAGHEHRFDIGFAGATPMLILGSLSPVYGNNPTFYALHVGADGSLMDVDTYAYDETARSWHEVASFDRLWSISQLSGASFARIHVELRNSASMRRRWDRQTHGWPPYPLGSEGTWEGDWRVAWCAQDLLTRDFERCAGTEPRRTLVLSLFALCIAAAVGVPIFVLRRLRNERRDIDVV
jgi:hypothetical protein